MSKTAALTKELIIENENKLLTAFQNCDIKTLEILLHDDVSFVIPNGELLNKITVLNNYRSGNSAFSEIKVRDREIKLFDNIAVVTMVMEMHGRYHDQLISRTFSYIRTWKIVGGNLKVIAVSGVQL